MVTREEIVKQSEALAKFYQEELLRPFPYGDLRAVREWGGPNYSDTIPTLDLYFSRIAGYSSSGKSVLRWNVEKLSQARADCCMSFFDEHPEYADLSSALDLFPVLKRDLELYEVARKRVLKIVSQIEEIAIDCTSA